MLESTRSSSNLRNGSSIGTEPVAMMTFFARYDVGRSRPRRRRRRRCRACSVPRPFAQVTLFFLNRNSMPLVFWPTTSSLRFIIVARSSDTSPTLHAVLGRVQPRELEVLGRLEQRLGRNAPDVDAGAAERLVHLDANGVEAELRGADRGDVTAGPAADDRVHRSPVIVYSISIAAGSSISSLTRTRNSTAC